jgi:hypothetical protein
MIWPARSPNLNPIEHVWDMVGRRVKDRTPAPANLRDLSAAVIQECQEIDQAVIQDLFEGMPRRMEAVIQARGGSIRIMSFKFITFRVKFLRGFVLFFLLEK